MKIKIIISCLLLSAVMFFSFEKMDKGTRVETLSEEPPQNEFILGAMSNVFDNTMYNYLSDSLRFNMWHLYAGPVADYGWTYDNGYRIPLDILGGDTNLYSPYIKDRISQNSQHKLMTLMQRPVTTYFAYGQRSDYQIEESTKVDPYYFFYTYNYSRVDSPSVFDTQDYSHNGGGAYVKKCIFNRNAPGSNAGLIVQGLKGNKEQANTFWPNTQQGDTFYDWYIRPRIRIDSTFANDPMNKNIDVCKIIITNWEGDSIRYILKVKNFKFNDTSIYNGNYLETYFPRDLDTSVNIQITAGNWFNPNQTDPFGHEGQIDFKVYWYDKCDMWIDRIRVENEPAKRLMTVPEQYPNLNNQLRHEILNIALAMRKSLNSKYEPYKFYIEEFEMNNLPTIGYVNKMIRDLTNDSMSLMVNYNYDLVRAFIPNRERYDFTPEMVVRYLVDSAKIREIFTESYGLEGWRKNDPHAGNSRESYNPPTLNYSGDYDSLNGRLVYKANSVDEYENWLQNKFQNGCNGYCQPITFNYIYKLSDKISKRGNIPFMYLLQAHSWWYEYHKLKEPTDQEISLQAYLALSYGAKGIMYFAYDSFGDYTDSFWGRGLSEIHSAPGPYPPRYFNAYGQEKWKDLGILNEKIKKLGPYFISFDTNRMSYVYHITNERNEMISNKFIKELNTYPAREFAPDPIPDLAGLTPETNSNAYLQAAFFHKENETEQTKYFMIVNRRCSPFINYNSADNIGGRRFVMMKVNPAYLPGFNNWKFTDVETGDTSLAFNKNDSNFQIFVGDFLPGEGKLFKLAPVMQEGGALVADEECGGDIECKGEVNNNGKNIFLKPGTNISFADHTARIKMEGGVFKSGYSQTQNSPVYLKGKDNSSWKGISLYGCDSVLIKDTHFSNISPYPVDSTYAVDIINCKFINIETGSFLSEGSLNAGCIRSGYVINEDVDYSACIQGNTFETDEGEIPALSFIATAGLTLPLIIDGNTFSSASSEGSSNAMLLSNISGGVIKNNTVSEYINSVILLSSSMDLYNNTITSGIDNSAGIQLYSFSTAFLKPSGMYYTGGYNDFTNLGDGSRNIELLTSYFNIYKGYNVFNVESNSDYHLIGSLYLSDLTNPTQNAKLNCFQFDGTNTAENQGLVWDNSGMPAEYIFTPYSCEIEEPIAYEVFNIGNRINDTIYYEQTGTGGGKSNYELRITNYELRAKAGKDESRINNKEENTEITFLGSLIDSIGINIRRRNYEKVSEDCMNILTNYPDSLESIGIIPKLYLADLRLDSAGNKITGLKTFLESLILNHSNNTALVKQAFYYIQKCKVSLKQYESAMTGFLEIMDENPYSYEGLVASWDYSATSLLFEGQGGAGGGISNYKLQISNDGSGENERENSNDEKSQIRNSKSQILIDDPNDKYDKKTFTGEDRKIIRENVFNSFELSREKETEKVRSLEKKVEEGSASRGERTELEKKKTLSETIKARKPADAFEHIKFVNNDIQKVFGVSGRGSEKSKDNIIPNEYSLSQNYPNPFNPVTHLEFGISNLGFVSLKVYDVLGREIKTLVNEIKPAGTYKIEFDGSNFASGVYFYRLEAGDFVQTKRMIMVK